MGRIAKTRKDRVTEIKARNKGRKEKKREKKLAELDGKPKQTPKTIDSMRIKDETTVGNLDDEENLEVAQDLKNDELSQYFEKSYVPKVLVATCDKPTSKTRMFCRELARIIPNATPKYRNRMPVKKMVKTCIAEAYSDIIIVNEDQKEPNGLLLIHLPNGPTAHFRLSNVRCTSDIRKNYKQISSHRPEVILNNFVTRLGYTVSRMLAAIFHYEPEFKGSRAVTFHNQRDYIFFRHPGMVLKCHNLNRHHRYTFTSNAKPRLMELGPRFTLKLRSLQQGTFDSITGEYEWIIQDRRHEMETSRRRFFL